jgi:hypothetical protein
LAALVLDVAVAYTVFVVTASAWLPDAATWAVILALPLLIVVWEASWLRLTGATVGHWLTGIEVVWPRRPPSFGRLCWRTVKRYVLFWMFPTQPSTVAPGILAVETVRPISFARVSRIIDGDGVVASREWSVAHASAVFALCLALPAVGLAAAADLEPPRLCENVYGEGRLPRDEALRANRTPSDGRVYYDCNPHELRNPLVGASLVGMVGAVLSVIGVADAWQHRERRVVDQAARVV